MSYTLTQREFTTLKKRLTRRINLMRKCQTAVQVAEYNSQLRQELVSAALKLQAECTHADVIFNSKGWPDAWSDWQRANDDASFIVQRWGASI